MGSLAPSVITFTRSKPDLTPSAHASIVAFKAAPNISHIIGHAVSYGSLVEKQDVARSWQSNWDRAIFAVSLAVLLAVYIVLRYAMHRLHISEGPISISRRNNVILSPFGPLRELATYLVPSSLHFSRQDDNLDWGRSDDGSLGLHASEMRMAEQDGHGQEATHHSAQLRMLHGKDSSFADHVAREPNISKRKSRPAPLFSSSLSTSPNKGGMLRRVDSSSGLKPRSPRSPLSPSQCSSPKRYNWGMRTPTSPRAPAAVKLQSPMFRALEEGLGAAVVKSPVDLSFTHAHRKRGGLAVGRQLRSPRRVIRDAGFMGGINGDGEERDTEKHQRG